MGKIDVIADGETKAGSSGLSNGADAGFSEGITIVKDLRHFICKTKHTISFPLFLTILLI